MKYCPACESEYFDHVTLCADCSAALVMQKPMRCAHCNERIDHADIFCTHCGVRTAADPDEPASCTFHPDASAIGICVVCAQPLCDECRVARGGKLFCPDHAEVRVRQDYALLYQSSMDIEAEMICTNLRSAGIESYVMKGRDQMYVTNVGALGVLNVMVAKTKLEDAREILNAVLSGAGLADDEPPLEEGARLG